ncbi:hypothetical protein [Flavobacterium reichenbachii]|uniref:Uncharacterized protein n=1 Tax=Flavobacterium reichenbachii TaxID=362418 RepID=A0A085ZMX7_9FLAO|nr:hypothetical protein [Flavobacterium reichenbachii]KFF05791.1 hypothetical protein IW19_09780 [Flavobacterium reichenbachii]OXB12679.1 hypothetical protein B0A68_17980 [Flavobacterium reichenbachii]
MYLEDFRNNEFDRCAILIPSIPHSIINLKYDIYSSHAYKFTVTSLRDLELSVNGLNNGIDAVPALNMWYLSVNSFLETILKILSLKTGITDNYSDMTIEVKYRRILNMLLLENSILEDKLYDKLSDFTLIHKNLHMDLNDKNKLLFKTANFSPKPFFINQIDVIQSMMIAVEIFQNFRFIFEGLDLMPNIPILTQTEKCVFEKLSVLQSNVIVPIINDILSKHKIKTKLIYQEKFKQFPTTSLFENKQILIISKNVEDEKYKWKLNSLQTDVVSYYHFNLMKKYNGREENFYRNYQAQNQKNITEDKTKNIKKPNKNNFTRLLNITEKIKNYFPPDRADLSRNDSADLQSVHAKIV